MEKYSYETRRQLEDKQHKELLARIETLSGDEKHLAQEIGDIVSEKTVQKKIEQAFRRGKYTKPSELFKGPYKGVLKVFVAPKYEEDFLYYIDALNTFQYGYDYNRRSLRTRSYVPSLTHVYRFLLAFYKMQFYGSDIHAYLKNELSEEVLDAKLNAYSMETNADEAIIAAELDKGNKKLEETIEEIIFSENNVGIVTTELIRGIVKSKNAKMHELLGRFLLAAKLQEGVRQAICENMDCGTTKAFLSLFDVIVENDLIRFAAVKRAVATWTGICDLENVDRLTAKMLGLMQECLKDQSKINTYLESQDQIELYIALWAMGFYEIDDALTAMQRLLKTGTRVQRLVTAYYTHSLEWGDYAEEISKTAISLYPDDKELVSAFMPYYMKNYHNAVYDALGCSWGYSAVKKEEKEIKSIPVTLFFKDAEEAEKHYSIIWKLYEEMSKGEIIFDPSIFPWHSTVLTKSELLVRLCIIAYALEDEEKINQLCTLLSAISAKNYSTMRAKMVQLLLHNPCNDLQQKALVSFVADKESHTQSVAAELAEKLTLSKENYSQLEEMLKYKKSEIRADVIKLLFKQEDAALLESIERLLKAKKEEVRTGGLDLILQLKKAESRSQCYEKAKGLVKEIEAPTDKEKILIEELSGTSEADEILGAKGYGLYNPEEKIDLPCPKENLKVLEETFKLDIKTLHNLVMELDDLVAEHKTDSYTDRHGEEHLLGENGFYRVTSNGDSILEMLPFKEMWKKFYQEKIKDFETILQLNMYMFGKDRKFTRWVEKDAEKLIGKAILAGFQGDVFYPTQVSEVINALYLEAKRENRDKFIAIQKEIQAYFVNRVPATRYYYTEKSDLPYRGNRVYRFTEFNKLAPYFNEMGWETEEQFKTMFTLKYHIENCYNFGKEEQDTWNSRSTLKIFDAIKAYLLGVISKNALYQIIFEKLDTGDVLEEMGMVVKENLSVWEERQLEQIEVRYGKAAFKQIKEEAKEVYLSIIEKILSVELRRGDTPTEVTKYIGSIKRIYGIKYLIQILAALGKETLDRSNRYYYYYYSQDMSKKESLSHLLSVCYPDEEDTAEVLREALKKVKVSEKRLVEVAMYAPQWIDIIEAYLGWKGLRSGCYYFMAHMNERFDEQKAAIIAKYTPLSMEELQNGAFDINWFKEAYKELGEEHFNILYESAKYISNGAKHSRARKFADAVNNKLEIEATKEEVAEKRNKDLLMSYALIPLKDHSKDLLARYEYLEQFLKESKKFGAQRRASEALAVEIALSNLAMNAGFSDVTRLTLNMETKLIANWKPYFEKHKVEETEVYIEVSEMGKSEIKCYKNGKALKSIPAKIKKDPYILELQEVHKKLKNQYSRTKKMLEQFMEDSVSFYFEELDALKANPVIWPLIKDLVFVSSKQTGYLEGKNLVAITEEKQALTNKTQLRIAHPFDLYKTGYWSDYQEDLFARQVKQPFKQVFRELYVKTDEEKEKLKSLRYAGYQIQPQKTVATLKGRRWVADYEEGLQKIYYKENIIARICALADWFSPSDIEAPTLEWVEFLDRKTYKPIKINEIPDIIFSEVMRDVDLAVSTAYAGGVDPETSHSTIEMRRVIVNFNLPLFKLTNVTVEEKHAIIEGTRGRYSVHLGSGVIHQLGGAQLNILPVHSQSRGKLFLPFIDEDPKTAEIMSKIVLLAEDQKIKDPYILNQIK